ncbi:hypothetical protein FC72_GL000319 [Companilactobacillus tucceti DSM 20183]|uniref:Uncharacterized protein n=1 Tax=Companilactobacillus tucceti DSM 20183 TaxID=1423811 RepID=A0A0R1IZH5_9LACO|nr:hypothetical protein [Companilactobacillus tucceti]KRK64592.1 hypothetical protein FC72_GL000319 [Companilactobacillus tucceti DSM 20183]
MKTKEKKELNNAFQSVVRQLVMFSVLSILLLATSKITNWIIMEFAGFAGVVYSVVLLVVLIYIAIIKH